MKYLLLFSCSLLAGLLIILFISYQNMSKSNGYIFTPKEDKVNNSIISIKNPPKDSLKGEITKILGKVKWESRIATEPATITQKQIIQQGEQIVTQDDGETTIEFKNVGIFNMSHDSDLSFIQTLPGNFLINQALGTADYLKNGDVPLSIRALHLLIQIDSGEIKVNINKEKPIITIDVLKGKINLAFNNIDYVSTVAEINAGERYIFNDSQRVGSLEAL